MVKYWRDMSIKEKLILAWNMRVAIPVPTLGEKVKRNLSLNEWRWRFATAESTANFEAEYDRYYENGYNYVSPTYCAYCSGRIDSVNHVVANDYDYHTYCWNMVESIN